MNIKKTPITFILALFIFCGLAQAQEEKQLSGKWRFSLDEQDVGEKESWFNKSQAIFYNSSDNAHAVLGLFVFTSTPFL